MSRTVRRDEKLDIAFVPQLVNNAGVITSPYFNLGKYRRALFVVSCGQLIREAAETPAITDAVVLQARCAKTIAGGDASDITGATATITANVRVQSASIELSGVANGKVCSVNNVVFTKAAGTDVPTRKFADAAGLIACVNAHVPKVIASSGGGAVVNLDTAGPGEANLLVASNHNTQLICRTRSALGYVEVDQRDLAKGKNFVAIRVTANTVAGGVNLPISAVLIRGGSRMSVIQHAAAESF